jgi:DNA-binding transcriptional ArsR family regulator
LTNADHFHISGIMKTNGAVAALAALAQDSRLDVFRLLVQSGRDGLPAGQIAERLRLPAPTLSFHLAQLRQAGLVTMRRDGRSLIYAADYDGMSALMGFLTENCCAGDAAACAPAVCAPATATVTATLTRRKGVSRQ